MQLRVFERTINFSQNDPQIELCVYLVAIHRPKVPILDFVPSVKLLRKHPELRYCMLGYFKPKLVWDLFRPEPLLFQHLQGSHVMAATSTLGTHKVLSVYLVTEMSV